MLDGRVRLLQPRQGYRVAIDPVLLAAAVPARAGDSVLDAGLGSGAASLCLLARVPGCVVCGIELQPSLAGLARRNATLNGMAVEVIEGDLLDPPTALRARQFAHVITNPPYAKVGSGTVPAYSASKGGVAQLTRSLAIAWAERGIRVNAVAPGWIATAMTRALREDEDRSRAILERTPMRRWGQPEDVAGAAVFLCAPTAAFITGVILPVDGGYSIA